jgi:hypothetical protein
MGRLDLSACNRPYATSPLRLGLWAEIGPRAGWIIFNPFLIPIIQLYIPEIPLWL